MTDTPRLGLPYPTDANPADVPTWMRDLALDLDGLVPTDAQGALGSRPAAGTAGRYYTTTNEGARPITYRDDGTAWRKIDYIPRVTNINLPANPSDGDEVLWQYDAALNPPVAWHMRWNATTSRWEYLGGSPLRMQVDFAITNGVVLPAYHDGGPRWEPCPHSGIWQLRYGAWLAIVTGPAGYASYSPIVGPAPAGKALELQAANGHASEAYGTSQLQINKGVSLTFGISSFNVSQASAIHRWVEVNPVSIQND